MVILRREASHPEHRTFARGCGVGSADSLEGRRIRRVLQLGSGFEERCRGVLRYRRYRIGRSSQGAVRYELPRSAPLLGRKRDVDVYQFASIDGRWEDGGSFTQGFISAVDIIFRRGRLRYSLHCGGVAFFRSLMIAVIRSRPFSWRSSNGYAKSGGSATTQASE